MRYSYKGNAVRKARPIMDKMNQPVTFNADHTWYAAAYVNRVNSGYFKEPQYEYTSRGQVLVASPNKELVRKILDSKDTPWTEEDIAVAEECRSYWQGQMLKLLAGPQSDFVQKAITLAGQDEYNTQFEIAIVSSLISSALRGIKNDDVNIFRDSVPSEWIGNIEDRLALTVSILQTKFVDSVGRYAVDGYVDGKGLVFWWSQENISVKTVVIKGRVRNHTTDKKNPNVKITFMNYVKVQQMN